MTCFESKLINDFGYHEMERRMKFHDKLIKASEICQAERTEFYGMRQIKFIQHGKYHL